MTKEQLLRELSTMRQRIVELEKSDEARKGLEDALRQSEAKYHALFDTANDSILLLDKTAFIDCNQKTLGMFGCEKDHILGQSPSRFSPPVQPDGRKSKEKALEHLEAAFTGEPQFFEWQHCRYDGTLFDTKVSLNRITLRGRPFLQAIVRDITGQRQAERSLRESEDTFRILAEKSFVGIYLIQDDTFKYVNSVFAETHGYKPEELINKMGPQALVLPEDWSLVEESMGKRVSGKVESTHYEFRIITKTRQVRSVEIYSSGTMYHEEPAIIGTLLDITERKRNEAQLRQMQKMEAIGTLAGGIAHDFNNILAGIIGFTEIALDHIPAESPAYGKLQHVLKSGARGRDLVKQILVFSRKTEYERKPVSLSPLITETADLLRASLPATIQITVKLAVKSDTIYANPTEIQQILMNLGTNAAYAMREKGGELSISLSDARIKSGDSSGLLRGAYVKITVDDTGTGIDPDDMEKIFEPFFTTKKRGDGTGMGLSVVYGIVKGLNGDIVAKSVSGKGSSFRVLLPKTTVDCTSERTEVEETPRGKEHILFVDDDEILAELGKDTLEALGYKVTAVTDSVKALKIFSKKPSRFDLVFTDQTMPAMTGLQLAGELLNMKPDLPVILCTGHSDTVSSRVAFKAGIKEFLMKPLTRKELAEAVRRILDKGQR